MIEQWRLLCVMDINFEKGTMNWKMPSKYHSEKKGTEAGSLRKCNNKFYCVIGIDGNKYKRGRLMFLAAYGRWPSPMIDHINGDSTDDRLCNLREATGTQNAWNHRPHSKKSALPMGVRAVSSGRFASRITVHKKQIHMGTFDTPEEAHTRYLEARENYYGEFA